MTERSMREDKIEPPSSGIDRWRWMMQWQVIHFFDNLIYNEDRNQGNVLIASIWKLWMIDHTRAFRPWKRLLYPEKKLAIVNGTFLRNCRNWMKQWSEQSSKIS